MRVSKLALAITAGKGATTATDGAVHNAMLLPPTALPFFRPLALSELMPTSDGKKGSLSAAERKEKNELLLLLLLVLLLLLLLPFTSSIVFFVCLFAVCLFVFL